MPPTSATQKLKDEEKGSRASSVSKDTESPNPEVQESTYLKELQKYVSKLMTLVAWVIAYAQVEVT